MFSPPALGPPGGLGAGTKDTLASLGHDGKRTSPLTPSSKSLSPASAGLSSFARLSWRHPSEQFCTDCCWQWAQAPQLYKPIWGS